MNEYELKKLTDCDWLNLYEIIYTDKNHSKACWIMASRKPTPITTAGEPDAVVIVPFLIENHTRKLVVTKQFRPPVWDYEYGFPAGLIEQDLTIEQTIQKELKEETGLDLGRIIHISNPIYSSSGITDESCSMAIVEARGRPSTDFLEASEQIETLLMTPADIRQLLNSDKKISAKAWGLFVHFALTDSLDLPDRFS